MYLVVLLGARWWWWWWLWLHSCLMWRRLLWLLSFPPRRFWPYVCSRVFILPRPERLWRPIPGEARLQSKRLVFSCLGANGSLYLRVPVADELSGSRQ